MVFVMKVVENYKDFWKIAKEIAEFGRKETYVWLL